MFRKIWCSFIALSCLLALFALSILPSGKAYASSIYDDLLQFTDVLKVSTATSEPIDITYTYENYMQSSSSCFAENNTSYQDALSNGVVTIYQYDDSEGRTRVRVGWLDSSVYLPSAPNQFWGTSSGIGFTSYYLKYYEFTTLDGNSVEIGCEFNGGGSISGVMLYSTLENSPADYDNAKLYITTQETLYPDSYNGRLIPTEAPKARYVALGDSFSSGEGNPPFEYGTDTSTNECHRSSQAYPRLLQNDPSLNLGPTAFVACSGATTGDVINGKYGEDSQLDALSAGTRVVTITVGGNDVGFKEFATACTVGICNFSTTVYSTIAHKIAVDLPAKLEDLYEKIAMRVPSNAQVYVVGYPHIAPVEMPTGPSSACFPLNGQSDDHDPDLNDGATVRSVVDALNGTIEDAVDELLNPQFTYIDPNASGSPFIGHEWCSQDRFFEIVTYNNIEHSFHPTSEGHEAYKTIIEEVIDQ